MKTRTLTIAIVSVVLGLITTTNSNAQLKLGPLLGVNFCDVTGDVKSDGMLIGFHIGALVNIGITKNIMIEPQVVYSTKGAKGKTEDLNFDYIEVPIWIRYQFQNGLNLNVGPYAGFLTHAKSGDINVKENFNSTDFGLGAGLGFQSAGGLGLAVNYNTSLGDIDDDQIIQGTTTEFNAKNATIKLTLSFMFGGAR